MMSTQIPQMLFTPTQIGPLALKHRIVMPPMSRLRAEWPSGVPSALMLDYYSQRASDGFRQGKTARFARFRHAVCVGSDHGAVGLPESRQKTIV